MPNITVYMDNKTHIGFLQLKDETRTKLRQEFIMDVKKRIEKGG